MTTPANPVDIFELLDIETREDTYSRLIVHLLGHSIGLRQRLLDHAFGNGAPRAAPGDRITLRHTLPGDAGIVDIFLQAPADSADRWAVNADQDPPESAARGGGVERVEGLATA